MRLLLDTHVIIWGLEEPRRIPRAVALAMGAPENEVLVSVVSLWEIAIKTRLGKLDAPADLPKVIERRGDYRILPISAAHAWRVRVLPALHHDPFDQLLIAQALIEDMTIVTHDRWIAQYAVPNLPV